MFSIKIAYKGKNILLPKGMDTLSKIENQLLSRFPGDFANGVALNYQGNLISEYSQIQQIVTTTGAKSLKLEAEPVQRKFSSLIRQQKKEDPTQKIQIKDIDLKVEKPEDPKVEIQEKVPVIEVPEIGLDVKVAEVKQEKGNKVEENVVKPEPADVQIDSMSSDSEVEKQKPEKIGTEDKQEVEIETEHKPQIIKCAIFGEEAQPDPVEIKCTIYNEIPKIEEPQPEVPQKQESVEQPKPEVIKCAIFGEGQNEYQSSNQQEELPTELCEISPGVYRCIFCKSFEVCNVCDRKRELNENSKLITLINKIVDKKVTERLADFEAKILQKLSYQKPSEVKKEQKPVEKQEKSKIRNELQKQIDAEIESIRAAFLEIDDIAQNKKQVQLGEVVFWTFSLKIKKQIAFRHKACLIQEKSGETIPVDLTNNMLVKVGPFKADKEGKIEKTYRISIIKQDESLQMFGPRFGFSIAVIKPKVTKMLTNYFRMHIDQIKKAYKCEDKPTEYLVERLREIGITEENYEENKSLIPEVICTL